MKRILLIIVVLLILIVAGLGIASCTGADLSLFSCSSCNEDKTPSKDDDLSDVIVGDPLPDYMLPFEGNLNYDLVKEHEVYYPTFSGKLTASFLPDDYFLSFNEDIKAFPQNGYVHTQYGDVYEITFNSQMLYDYIKAGDYVAVLFAYYENEDKMYRVGETSLNIESNLYKADYLTYNDEKFVGMYNEELVNEQNFRADFELVSKNVGMYPTLTMFMYLSKSPTKLELSLQGQTKEIDSSDIEIISHGTYYEVNVNKIVIFDTIAKGDDELIVKVKASDGILRETALAFTSKYDYYSEKYIDFENQTQGEYMDSDEFWLGPL